MKIKDKTYLMKQLMKNWSTILCFLVILFIFYNYVTLTSIDLCNLSHNREDWNDMAEFAAYLLTPLAILIGFYGVRLTIIENRREKIIDFWLGKLGLFELEIQRVQSLITTRDDDYQIPQLMQAISELYGHLKDEKIDMESRISYFLDKNLLEVHRLNKKVNYVLSPPSSSSFAIVENFPIEFLNLKYKLENFYENFPHIKEQG